jgi:hypothetical protein
LGLVIEVVFVTVLIKNSGFIAPVRGPVFLVDITISPLSLISLT